jgi:receptor protein-tyrosine kinase/non-specific protein-tyrosine kinase
MSRIDEALQKANMLRESGADQKKPSNGVPAERLPIRAARRLSLRLESPYLVAALDPVSPISEEYRKLKSFVVRFTKGPQFLNTLMITSTLKNEGKSITTINLAITLACDYDHTVLLVDTDFRAPSLHKYLGFEPKLGLTDCIMNGLDIGEVLIKTDVEGLTLLPAGSRVKNSAELISSERMKSILSELKERYSDRYILFDTPPALPFADAYSLSSMVDCMLFVVREGSASAEAIRETLEKLGGAKLVGTIYNCSEIVPFQNYYNYYRQYQRT